MWLILIVFRLILCAFKIDFNTPIVAKKSNTTTNGNDVCAENRSAVGRFLIAVAKITENEKRNRRKAEKNNITGYVPCN